MEYDVLVVGAGVTGGMLARELSKYQLSVCVVEKENDVAMGATKANSGIVHGGYDPEPGTLKAKLNTEGVKLLFETAEELHVPYKRNGSMVCAFSAAEEPAIHELFMRGQKNSIPGLALLSGDQARELEPALSHEVTLVLHVSNSGIICPYELTIAALGNAMDNGVTLLRNFCVEKIHQEGNLFCVTAADGRRIRSRFLCNCAGGYADQIADMAGDCIPPIIPRAGEYMLLDKSEGEIVSHTLFQVPTLEGKGILVTPTVDGNLLCGPTATKVTDPEARDTTSTGLAMVSRLATKTVPGVDFRQVITSFTGVRASTAGGDFVIERSKSVPTLIHVAAIDSPGLTCCVSIAKHVTGLLEQAGLVLKEKSAWDGCRSDPHVFRKMSEEDKNRVIRREPAFGKIVCRCEMVSEGEILDALLRNPPALDLDGVKRRTRSGMGRCQGGFCSPYVMELISRVNGIPMESVTKSGPGSEMVTGRIGEADDPA